MNNLETDKPSHIPDLIPELQVHGIQSSALSRKTNFVRISLAYFLYSPADNTVIPAISGGFGFYKEQKV